MTPFSFLSPAKPGARARPGLPPSEERLRELRQAVRFGRYRVSPELVALAVLDSGR